MEINIEIERALERIRFGTDYEEADLYRLGKVLAVPDKALKDIAYYEAIANGKTEGEPCKFDHWELCAIDLAAAIACAYVYKNRYRFLWENFSLEKNFAGTLLKQFYKHKAVTRDGKAGNGFAGFLKALLDPPGFGLDGVYSIRIGYRCSDVRRIAYWKQAYAKIYGFEDNENFPCSAHPLVYATIQKFLRCGPYESSDIAEVLVGGLRKCAGES